ncbi:MAG: LTA synthase family protein [Coriobacteriia bacterium]|nr:LTA synthase family protein [Coriobacteriia bacterium]
MLRFLLCVAAVLFGLVLIELPFNPSFILTIEPAHVLQNLLVLGILFAVIYMVGLQTRGTAVAFWAVCLGIGCANHYLMSFRGTPVIPSDLFALATAAQVAEGYALTPDASVLAGAASLLALAVLTFRFVPPLTLRARGRVLSAVLGLVLAAGAAVAFVNVDAKLVTGASVKAFHMDRTYQKNGTALSYVVLGQQLLVHEPQGYSDERARELMDQASDLLSERGVPVGESNGADQEGSGAAQAGASKAGAGKGSSKKPTVIAIMNETFADMTLFEELRDCPEATLSNFNRLAGESVASGYSYVPCYGAGTCNSEFEFLTGASLAFLGSGAYPYQYHDLSRARNLARFFGDQGYATSAIHPAAAANWNRDKVYPALGFGRFYDISSFEGAEQLREKTTDRETYAKVLELLDSTDQPQFIFDVTYQNHGGYKKHLVDEGRYVHAKVNGGESPELNEFLSCLQQSDQDLAWLVEQLEQRDEPVVLVFFGDHMPSIANQVCGTKLQLTDNAQVAQSQKRYTTPYLIWANYDAVVPDAATGEAAKKSLFATSTGYDPMPRLNGCPNQVNLSLNYLGSTLIEVTGLPLDGYFAFNAAMRDRLPVLNTVAYMDERTNWHKWDQDAGEDQRAALEDYQVVQHWSLFGNG